MKHELSSWGLVLWQDVEDFTLFLARGMVVIIVLLWQEATLLIGSLANVVVHHCHQKRYALHCALGNQPLRIVSRSSNRSSTPELAQMSVEQRIRHIAKVWIKAQENSLIRKSRKKSTGEIDPIDVRPSSRLAGLLDWWIMRTIPCPTLISVPSMEYEHRA